MLVIPDAAEPYSPLPESVVVPVHSSRSMVRCSGLLLCGVRPVAVQHFSHRLAPEAGTAASWVCLSLLMCRLRAAQPQALGSIILRLQFVGTQRVLQSTDRKRTVQVEDLLNSIPTLFEGTQVQENCMAAATQAAVQTLKVRPCSGPASPTKLCPLPHQLGLPCLTPSWGCSALNLPVSSALPAEPRRLRQDH